MRHSTGTPTKAEAARMTAIKELGVCVACTRAGVQKYPMMVDIHHLLSGNRRRGHMATVGLCRWHHLGQTEWGMTAREMTDAYGPSFQHGSKPFRAMFGTDNELLELQNQLLETR